MINFEKLSDTINIDKNGTSYSILFNHAKPDQTWEFFKDGYHLSIFVDLDNIPIAVVVWHEEYNPSQSYESIDFEKSVLALYGNICELSIFAEKYNYGPELTKKSQENLEKIFKITNVLEQVKAKLKPDRIKKGLDYLETNYSELMKKLAD